MGAGGGSLMASYKKIAQLTATGGESDPATGKGWRERVRGGQRVWGSLKGVVGWAEMPPNTPPVEVLQAALDKDDGYTAIARLRVPRIIGNDTAFWAGFRGGNWAIPLDRLGVDRAAGDQPVRIDEIVESSITTTTEEPGGDPGDRPLPPRRPPGPAPGGIPGLGNVIWAEPPREIIVRRCKGRGRMAIDGLCYDKSLLPAKFRLHKSRKAPVSWSDANHIRKGRTASTRIKRYADASAKEARKLIPRRAPRRKAK